MKRERIWVNDTSKLEGLGFRFYPNDAYSGRSVWRFNGLRVDEDGFVLLGTVNIKTIMKIIELGKLGLIEQRTQVRKPKYQVMLTEDEYEDFKKWKGETK